MALRHALVLAAVMALTVALPSAAAGATLSEATGGGGEAQPQPEPGSEAGTQGAWTGEYSMYRARTHTVQKTDWTCVGASIQMMVNLVKGTSDKSKAGQTMYWRYAQDNSRYPITDNGADVAGWAAALRHWNVGNYTVGVSSSMQSALGSAAKRMRLTGKPVGMIVWGRHGGHAWVMTGFRSSADPQMTDSYSVTSIQAMGPLYPYGTIGGKSYDPGPRQWVGYTELRKKFTEYVASNSPDWNGRWLTVLP